jgi:hypothetical protein
MIAEPACGALWISYPSYRGLKPNPAERLLIAARVAGRWTMNGTLLEQRIQASRCRPKSETPAFAGLS